MEPIYDLGVPDDMCVDGHKEENHDHFGLVLGEAVTLTALGLIRQVSTTYQYVLTDGTDQAAVEDALGREL